MRGNEGKRLHRDSSGKEWSNQGKQAQLVLIISAGCRLVGVVPTYLVSGPGVVKESGQ